MKILKKFWSSSEFPTKLCQAPKKPIFPRVSSALTFLRGQPCPLRKATSRPFRAFEHPPISLWRPPSFSPSSALSLALGNSLFFGGPLADSETVWEPVCRKPFPPQEGAFSRFGGLHLVFGFPFFSPPREGYLPTGVLKSKRPPGQWWYFFFTWNIEETTDTFRDLFIFQVNSILNFANHTWNIQPQVCWFRNSAKQFIHWWRVFARGRTFDRTVLFFSPCIAMFVELRKHSLSSSSSLGAHYHSFHLPASINH